MRRILFLTIMALSFAIPAAAQSNSFGIRAGVSGDPDQFVFGGHLETEPLLERLSFRPNIEVGVGDDITLFAINLEFAYSIPIENTSWRVYFGGGPALNLYSFDGDSEVEGGFNVMLGIQHSRGLFTEFKVGAIDSPEVKAVVGYAFR